MRWIVALLLLAAPALAQEVALPPGDPAQAPVVLVLHGGGGTGADLRRHSGFDALAAAAGVVAVYPDAPRRVWNDGRNPANPRDDVAALLAMVDALAARGIGDGRRLYVIGHSNGGGMAMRIACTAPERIAGIAIVATKTLLGAPCAHPDAPVPALFLHGTMDTIAPHAGRRTTDPDRRVARLARRIGEAASAAETLALWSRRNRCSGETVAVTDPDPADGITLRVHDFTGCAAPLRWVEMVGAGHGWPGATTRPALLRAEPHVNDIDAGAAALAFWFR
ncbi:MAG: alpha/beta fold hydrolase [Rhodobacteraceae bacterium]|nr:alpha/beta fold hydrolase [Paracoccaceae bacterium]